MQPRDRLSAKEIQVATLVWQGLTNKDIAAVLTTSEQVVKNYLRTTFDKLGVWTRLELALYVAGHGGANWRASAEASVETAAWNAVRKEPVNESQGTRAAVGNTM
jgi:DNA-binding CsgD family transcriptional regulator